MPLKALLLPPLLHHMALLRLLGRLLRLWPFNALGLPAQVDAARVEEVLAADERFDNPYSNDAVTQDFALVARTGPAQRAQHGRVQDRAQQARPQCAQATQIAARQQVGNLQLPFDGVQDYLAPVCWAGLGPLFEPWAQALASNEEEARALWQEIRTVGMHMLNGVEGKPTPAVLRASQALDARILRAMPQASAEQRADVRGMLWVSHPSCVQQAALVLQAWFEAGHPYKLLQTEASALGAAAWTDPAFRERLQRHVLEGMRLRPAFPLLARSAPRDTQRQRDGEPPQPLRVRAGSGVALVCPAAMADPARFPQGGRYQADPVPAQRPRHLVFGHGPRSCPAAEAATLVIEEALLGLLTLPPLRWSDGWQRLRYQGPVITELRLHAR